MAVKDRDNKIETKRPSHGPRLERAARRDENEVRATDERWRRAVQDLKRDGLVRSIGISVNRGEPWNGLAAIRTGLIDAAQVVPAFPVSA